MLTQYTFSSFVGKKLVGAYFVGRLSVVLLICGRKKLWEKGKVWAGVEDVGGHLRPPRGVHEVHLRKLLTVYLLGKVITNLCDCMLVVPLSCHYEAGEAHLFH